MARELILTLKPPTAGGALHLIQQLNTAVSSLGDGGRQAMAGMTSRVKCVGSRDAMLVLCAGAAVSDDQLRAVAQIAAAFVGTFRVEAAIGGEVVAPPSASRSAQVAADRAKAKFSRAARAAAPPAPRSLEAPADAALPTIDAGDQPESAAEAPAPEAAATPYDSLTKAELQEICKSRGLPIYGKKSEVVARLAAHDAESAGGSA